MNIPQIFFLFLLSLLSLQCSKIKEEVSGIWQLNKSENCDKNFLGLNAFVYPYAKYGHKIYILDSLFYNPSMKQEDLPFERKYRIKDKQILLDDIGHINFTRKDSILILEKEECKLTFIRILKKKTILEKSLSNISFYVSKDGGREVDSLHLQKNASNTHIFRIASSIAKENLDRTFDEGVSDSNEHKIVLHLHNGQSFRINSYGKYETPFEIQTLIKYLLGEI